MNIIYYFLLLMFARPILVSLDYYLPGIGTILYWGLFFYILFAGYKRPVRARSYSGYNTRYNTYNRAQNQQKTTQNTSSSNHSNIKKDVIDVEFSEREVE